MIILMVMGHTWSPFVYQIYLFHVPAFFFISGYAANREKKMSNTLKQTVVRLGSYIILNITFIILNYILCSWQITRQYFNNSGKGLFEQIADFLLLGRKNEMGGATWFLFALCITSIISKLIQIVGDKTSPFIEVLGSIAVVFCGYYLSQNTRINLYDVDLGMIGLAYYQIGSLSRKYQVGKRLDPHYYSILCIALFLFFSIYWQAWQNWPTRNFGDPGITFLGSLVGIYLVYVVSTSIENSILGSILSKLGKRTFAIMFFHFLVFRIISIVLNLLGVCTAEEARTFPTPIAYWYIYSCVAVVTCCCISMVAEKSRWSNYIINAKWRNR